MTWFNDLLRSPPAESPVHRAGRPAGSGSLPTVEPDTARAALATATDVEHRRRLAEELGCALAALRRMPSPDDGPDVWVAAVCHLPDKSLALHWLETLSGDTCLGEVAVHGRFAEVRVAAVQRISDPDILGLVARLSRGKDKGVFRHCSDVLRQRRHSADRAQRAAQLAVALHELLEHAPLAVSSLLDLRGELQALESAGEPLTECRALLDQADERLRQESEARRNLQTCRDEAAELAAQCANGAWPEAQLLDQWRQRYSSLDLARANLPDWLSGKAAWQTLVGALHQIQTRLSELEADALRIQTCEQFLSALGAQPIEPATAAAWEALPKPDYPEMREGLQTRWQALQAPPQTPPQHAPARSAEPPAPQPRIDLNAVRTLLEQMEQALEGGHLADADAAAKRIKAALGSAALRGELASRYQHAQTRLVELSGWAKWGVAQKRSHLVAAAEELLAGQHDVDYLARAVPALREEWKQLGSQPVPAHGEWERFDAALVKAYRPVAALRAEEAARRAQARTEKEALCAQWEAFVAAVDWEQPDYAAIEARRTQALNLWRTAARAGFRDERLLRKRFDALIADIDQRVAAARSSEVQRREQLIGAAEALRELPDLRGAMTEAKALQERWRNEAGSLRLPRGEEQRLWHRFRAACDAVFARRDSERAEQAAQREKRAQARVALLDAFEVTVAGTDAGQIKRALAQFRTEWDASKPGAGAPSDALDQRARDLQQKTQQRIDALQRQAHRTRLDALAQQAAPAEDLDEDALAAGREAREALLIDLEIALDLPTPEQSAPARRRRQLERLQDRFRGGREQRPKAEELLSQWYATPASPDEAMNQRVAAVVSKLLEQGQAAARK
ncbi:MAG TPA: DUF349 domain-containing protein [Burkholderiaceae bacterium]|nr:DUF349 domain-containing protein [Burkholderiaceae bacterium]